MHKLKHASLQLKFMFFPTTAIVCLVLFVFFYTILLNNEQHEFMINEQQSLEKFDMISDIFSEISSNHVQIINLLSNAYENFSEKEIYKNRKKNLSVLHHLSEKISTLDKAYVLMLNEEEHLKIIKDLMSTYKKLCLSSIYMESVDRNLEGKHIIDLNEKYLFLNENFIVLLDISRENMKDFFEKTREKFHRKLLIFSVIIIVIIIALMTMGIKTGRRMSKEIHDKIHLITRLTHGDKEIEVSDLDRPDEIGTLSRGIQLFKESLLAQEKARKDAEAANRSKSTFVATMSHELRTPMNAIIGYSEMLIEEAVDTGQKDIVPDLQKIHTAGKHLLALINDILDLSKIEAGKMELHIETFSIQDLVDEVLPTISPMVADNANIFDVQVDEHLAPMSADQAKVRQSLLNLLSNACKFTEHGHIGLHVSQQETEGQQWCHISVSDTGIGITPEQQSQLFHDFVQADSSTTRQYGGTGLGLAISQHFCQMMGGNITLESTFGQGSTFTMWLPVGAEQRLGRTKSVAPASPHTGVSESAEMARCLPTLLVIDDDPAVCDLLSRSLNKQGFVVVTASDGLEGLQYAKDVQPAAIILDVLLPGLDGWDVLSELKADPDLADIPVIMQTIVDDKNRGYRLGAADYLVKPFDQTRMAHVLRRSLPHGSTGPVLIIEDDMSTRELVQRMLTKQGFEVITAENGRKALKRLAEAQSRPSLILLDLMMPEMDGFTFLLELRKVPEWQDIPVVVVTAKDITDEEHVRLNGYVNTLLQKGQNNREELLNELCDLVKTLV